MSLVICYFDVSNGAGKCKENGVYILYGPASVEEYCRFTANAIIRGASVVAVAHGLDVTENGGKAVIVYASKETCEPFGDWIQGKTLDEVWPDETATGSRAVNCINIDGEDYLRDDKNCVPKDKIGAEPKGTEAGWYCVSTGEYLGKDLPQTEQAT